jgi:hypothetical protein
MSALNDSDLEGSIVQQNLQAMDQLHFMMLPLLNLIFVPQNTNFTLIYFCFRLWIRRRFIPIAFYLQVSVTAQSAL